MHTSLLTDVIVSSIQVACVVAVGGALAAIVRVDAADVRYLYWRALLALCLALPWLQARQTIVSAGPASSPALAVTAPAGAVITANAVAVHTPSVDWVSLAGWILIAGIAFRLARVAVGLWRLRRLRTAGYQAPLSDVHDEIQELVRTRAEIRYVPAVSPSPLVFGVLWCSCPRPCACNRPTSGVSCCAMSFFTCAATTGPGWSRRSS
jgi:hypothetical protein